MQFKIDDISRTFFPNVFKKKQKNVILDDLIFFTDQIYVMHKAGNTLADSLAFVQEQTDNENLKSAFYTMSIRLQKGMSFSKALADYPEIFPEYYVENIYAAEISGTVQETLKRMSKYLKSEKKLKLQIKKNYLYIVIVFLL